MIFISVLFSLVCLSACGAKAMTGGENSSSGIIQKPGAAGPGASSIGCVIGDECIIVNNEAACEALAEIAGYEYEIESSCSDWED